MIQYVQVPVPQHLVPAVMALITQSAEEAPRSTVWTEKELRKLWNESADNIRGTLIYLASHAGTAISGATIAREVMGKESKGHSIAGMMGAFGRRMKGRHKGRSPIVAEYDALHQVWQYSIASPEVAQIILRFAGV